jgi:methyl-accepting chemotaxis protein
VNEIPETPDARHGTPISLDLKVLAAVGSLVVLLVVAVAIAIALVVAVGNNAHLAERQGRFVAAVNAAALWAKTLANDERGYFISGDVEFVNQMDGEIELARAAFAAAAEAASPEQRATLAEAREGFERWLEAVQAEIAVYQSGDEDAAIESSLGPTRAMRHQYEGWLSDAASLGVDSFQDATSSVGGTASTSILILMGYLLVAVITGTIIALWIVRSVLRPSYALVRLLAESQEESSHTPA